MTNKCSTCGDDLDFDHGYSNTGEVSYREAYKEYYCVNPRCPQFMKKGGSG